METEELTKLVDGIYKNILDKFNPGARQMIIAGKAYLKALHGAAAASRMYVEAVGKLGRQAQQGTWGGSADIGTALMKVVEVYREIQDQQMNILKAFYVDLLVPLETNLEKDTKVVQSEQKRFLQQHKLRSESYSKAAATIKKQRKKTRNAAKAGSAIDKEMKSMQVLEEEKTKLDAFCEQSLKNAMTQERRRYGFVLERQCSLAKHWLAYHSSGANAYTSGLEEWLDVARTREFLPPNVEAMFVSRMRQVSFWADEEVYASPRVGDDDDRASVGSALRKTRSVDASCLDVRSIADLGSPAQGLSRAKSDFNLQASLHSLEQDISSQTPQQRRRPKSLAPGAPTSGWEAPLARALYAYHSSGDNQLSFMESDVVALVGDRTKGWQYGENLRTHQAGWFPLAYTEMILDEHSSSPARWSSAAVTPNASEAPPAPLTHATPAASPAQTSNPTQQRAHAPPRMFGDTITAHRASKTRLASGSPGLPPTLPAPVPKPAPKLTSSMSSTFGGQVAQPAMKTSTSSASFTTQARVEVEHFPPQTLPMRGQQAVNKAIPPKGVVSAVGVGGVGNVSLHSSNDSGFSNEPPPQPEVDYSDEESHRNRVPISKLDQYTPEQRAYIMKTQSLKRPAKTNGIPAGKTYMTDDQQIMLRSMLDMDKDSQKVKRTKSFWKFGRTTSEEIMEGMSLWQHRDIVDTVPEYKKKLFAKMKEAIQSVSTSESAEPRKKSVEKVAAIETQNHPKETIDRKDLKTTNGMRQSRSMSSIQNGQAESRKTSTEGYEENNMKKKSMSEKSILEEKDDDFNPPRNESRSNHSDITNTSTIKTNFENSFYNDESGEGFVVKTVKRREILQRYDNDSSSEVNSVASSTDPYDCIIVDDHMTPRKMRENDKRRQDQVENEIKARKEATYMPEFEEIEITPITPHVRSTLSNERSKSKSHERSPPHRMEFKTFKDNDSEIKMFSASSETLKYKENEQNGDRYGSPRRDKSHDKRIEEPYNGHDEGTLKYKKHSNKDEKPERRRGDYEEQLKKGYPQLEVRQKKDYGYQLRENEREPMREPTREPMRVPTREPMREPVREPMREPGREAMREPVREPMRDQLREREAPMREREPIREREMREPARAREPMREPMSEQMREPTIREKIREQMREPVREPRKDYPSFDSREIRKEFANFENREPRKRERPNRSYDDSSLKYNGQKQYEANISYFSDQERRDSKYDYDTDSKKAAKTKMRHEEHARRYMEQQINGKYAEQSDDQKFDEAMKQKPQLLPRTKLLKSRTQLDSLEHLPMSGHTFGPWYDLWGREREAVVHK